jgi:hypothetical protein
MAFYVAGFTVAGAFVGLSRPLVRGAHRLYGVMAVAGGIVMNTIAVSGRGVQGMDPIDWIAATTLGVLFGLAGAFGFLRAR